MFCYKMKYKKRASTPITVISDGHIGSFAPKNVYHSTNQGSCGESTPPDGDVQAPSPSPLDHCSEEAGWRGSNSLATLRLTCN